jgi:chromosome segregation ATPase
MEKKNKTYVADISELQKKLSENERNYVGELNELKKKLSEDEKKKAEMTSLKDELNKLKKSLEESSVEKSRLVRREKDLMEENSNIKTKLSIKDDAHKLIVDKLKAEIEELKGENKRQYKAGYDKAVNQVVSFTTGLKS